MKIELICTNCGGDFEVEFKHRDKKFCNRTCYFEHARKNKTIGRKFDSELREVRKCLICETEFTERKKHNKLLCSDICRKKWNSLDENKHTRILASKNKLIDNYGVDSIFKTDEFKGNVKNLLLDVHGVTNPMFKTEFVDNLKETLRIKQINNLLPKLNLNFLELLDEYSVNKNGSTSLPYNFKCLKCDNIFTSTVLGSGKIPICRKCNPLVKNSKLEEGIRDFINENNIKHIDNDRTVLDGKEIDLLLSDNGLGLEINGNYYHSEKYGQKDKKYHLNKTNLANSKGIKLIHIFEDEILYKKDIVLSRLGNLLKLNTNKIYGRKCIIRLVNKVDSSKFLDDNHIQGNCVDKIRLGLYYDGELVSLMTFGKERKVLGHNKTTENVFELIRFVNKINTTVIGGFSKLLKNFITDYKPYKITTYADIRWSGIDPMNTVYNKNGFKYIGNTLPNYWYLKVGEFNNRYHRFNYRKDVLVKDGYDVRLSEKEIMELKGYDRIWDCGSMRFELIIMNTGASFDNV